MLGRGLNTAWPSDSVRLIHEQVEQEKRHLKKAELRRFAGAGSRRISCTTGWKTIVWLAREGRNSEVVEMTMAFTGILRDLAQPPVRIISRSSGRNSTLPAICRIRSMRYGSIMRYTIDIDPRCASGIC